MASPANIQGAVLSTPLSGAQHAKTKFLALVVIACLYGAFVWASISARGFFDYAGVDYRGFLASAQIVRDHGFAAVYDLKLQAEYQAPLYRYATLSDQVAMDVNPTPYLPVFVAAFLPFSFLDPVQSYAVWVALNAVLFLFYLRRLVAEAGLAGKPLFLMGLVLSLPVLSNLFFGQVNVWLLVCVGEALIAFRRGNDLLGGAWLAGLLLKPQMLIVVLPGLLLARKMRGLAGFAVAGGAILILSLALAGPSGLLSLFGLLTGYVTSQGLATNFPQSMMNWRALALNLGVFLPAYAGWAVGVVGIVLTIIAAFKLWGRQRVASASDWSVVLLGTFAATSGLAWHSHVHTELVLLAPLVFLAADARLPSWISDSWIYVPMALFVLLIWVYSPLAISFGLQNWAGAGFAHIVTGFSYLLFNSLLLLWSVRGLLLERTV